ncbi:MAG: hypothetical protein WCW64_10430, partial [Phycisphaerae bacterium]
MCKCKIGVVFLFFVLFVAQAAFSVETVWTNGAGTRVWSTSTNWNNGVPTSTKDATCNTATNGPVISSGAATAQALRIGTTASCTMVMNGGTLSTSQFLMLGAYAGGGNGRLNVSGGTINILNASHCYVGYNGNGNLTVMGGTVNVGDYLIIGTNSGSTGHVQLDGGKVYANHFRMRYYTGSTGTMNITKGELIVTGNIVSTVNTYIANGWITAYDNPATSTVYAGYNSSTNKTHIWADKRVGTVTIYTSLPDPCSIYFDFWKNSGFNAMEFVEGGYGRKPSLHPSYYATMHARIAAAKAEGFKVTVILLACVRQWTGPNDTGIPGEFAPEDTVLLDQRLGYIEDAVIALNNADRFVLFAGDPGIATNINTTISDFSDVAKDVRDVVQANAPNADFGVINWALGEWKYPLLTSWYVQRWIDQVDLAQTLQADTSLYRADTSVQLVCDNYYRTMALDCYVDAGLTPELYPVASDMATLRGRAVKDIWAWPHFLISESDDAYSGGAETSTQTQLEVRYIRDMVNDAKTLKLDGITSNMGLTPIEALNAYAFARFCVTEAKTADQMIDEIAGLLATSATKATMANILRFVENNSTWHLSMPASYRLANLNSGTITTAALAISALDNNV